MVKSNMFIIIAVLAFLYNHIDIDESHSYSYKENMGVNGVEILKMTREPTFNSQSINNSLFLFFTDKCLFILVLALSNKKKFTEFIVLFLTFKLPIEIGNMDFDQNTRNQRRYGIEFKN